MGVRPSKRRFNSLKRAFRLKRICPAQGFAHKVARKSRSENDSCELFDVAMSLCSCFHLSLSWLQRNKSVATLRHQTVHSCHSGRIRYFMCKAPAQGTVRIVEMGSRPGAWLSMLTRVSGSAVSSVRLLLLVLRRQAGILPPDASAENRQVGDERKKGCRQTKNKNGTCVHIFLLCSDGG